VSLTGEIRDVKRLFPKKVNRQVAKNAKEDHECLDAKVAISSFPLGDLGVLAVKMASVRNRTIETPRCR
jgi:hypothetical protein